MEEVREDGAQEEPVQRDSEELEGADREEENSTEESAEEEMARMQRELETADDMMLRLAAEMDNYKKRVIKERESLIKYAANSIIQELLLIMDNFERAIESADNSKDFNSFLEGVKMIYKQTYSVLENRGVSTIDAIGKTFDPNIHEAVMQVGSEEHPENIVVSELQKGYMLHDRVIRPSMVAVSKKAEEE